MTNELFLTIYVLLMALLLSIEIYLLTKGKGAYLKPSYKSLKKIIGNLEEKTSPQSEEELSREMQRFYNEYVQEIPQIKKWFPNVVIWIDAIIFRIDYGHMYANILEEHIGIIKHARDILESENPYNKCEKYQQGILHDLGKLETSENKIVIQNIINRTEEEFLRLSGDIKKNAKLNIISIAIGVIGIVVSILMALMNI